MKKIAVVGGGISSVGAIARIVGIYESSASKPKVQVDHFSTAIQGPQIRTGGCTFRLPDSDENGYMARWGAVLGLRVLDVQAFRVFERMYLGNALAKYGIGIDDELLSFDTDAAPFFCVSRIVALDKTTALLARAEVLCGLRRIDDQVLNLQYNDGSWALQTACSTSRANYDCVVLCAGPLSTPTLLFNSGLLTGNGIFPLKDHVVQFGAHGTARAESTLFTSSRDVQVVRSTPGENGCSHDVSVRRSFAFRPSHMEALYWRIAGRTRVELLSKGQVELLRLLFKAAISGVSFRAHGQDFRITVWDDRSCKAELEVSSGDPIVNWSSSLQPGAVSAYHFHGPLNHCKDVEKLADSGVHIGDLSQSRSLKGVNSGCISFQAGFVGMNDALLSVGVGA